MLKHENYFEGILQLRNTPDEVIDFVIKQVEKKENSDIANIKKVINGVDIYLSSQKYLRSLGNKLQNSFGGQLIVSRKIHTRNRITSRDVYRVNVLFRMPNFKKGDIIDYKGDKIKIVGIHKKVLAKDIKTGRKLNLSFKDLF